jgi:hypothetical protein
MTRPGQRPQFVAFDVLPWICIAGFVALDGVIGVVLAWAAIPLIYFSIKLNRPDSLATSSTEGGLGIGAR